jgi:propionate CoA-transferase
VNILTKAQLLVHILRWRFTWSKRDTHAAVRVPGNPKFMGPRDAAKLIPDGAVVGVAGLAASMRASILYWAIREVYEETGHPKNLSLITIAGHGGRGRIPGTLEELGLKGLVTRMFTGHTETYKSLLRLADSGDLELQCLPQGTLALILGALSRGEDHVINDTGAGTFVDPRVGRGTPVVGDYPQHVEMVGDRFKYTLPKIDVAIFNAPAADRKGNIYVKNAAMVCEAMPNAKAAKQNGGQVIVNVSKIVDEGYDDVFWPGEEVDAVVVWGGTEQVAGVPHYRHWPCFTLGAQVRTSEWIKRVAFTNKILGITPRRSHKDDVLARLGAAVFVGNAHKGCHVDIGVGLPEEVSRLLFRSGAMKEVTLMTESGVVGGLPTPGVFFGAAINPEEMISTDQAFERIYLELDVAILGALEVDSQGNVNVSKRGEGAINYVGPGGFIDLVACAELIIFCCAWGDRADIRVEGNRINVVHPGKPKFIEQVAEATFSGPEALKKGKRVFYVTHVGAFQLTERGMELIRVLPGVDIQKDILDVAPMNVVLPENNDVPVVDASYITGNDFQLQFQ